MVLLCNCVPSVRFGTKPDLPENILMATRNEVKMATMNIKTMRMDFHFIHLLSGIVLLGTFNILRRSQVESLTEVLCSKTSLIINTVYDRLKHRTVVFLNI